MCNLGYSLKSRGYRVTLFGWPDVRDKIEASRLEFHEIGDREFPKDSVKKLFSQISKPSGINTISYSERATKMTFMEAPKAQGYFILKMRLSVSRPYLQRRF